MIVNQILNTHTYIRTPIGSGFNNTTELVTIWAVTRWK